MPRDRIGRLRLALPLVAGALLCGAGPAAAGELTNEGGYGDDMITGGAGRDQINAEAGTNSSAGSAVTVSLSRGRR
jgi:hypothetical protein